MKKFWREPWCWILAIDLSALLLSALVESLWRSLPVSGQEYYVMHLEHGGWRGLAGLCMLAFSLGFMAAAFFRRGVGWGRKFAAAGGYLLLGIFSLGILLPTLGAARERAKRIACQANLKQIRLAVEQYAADSGGWLPPDLETLERTVYLTDRAIFHCPSREGDHSDFSDYLYSGAGHRWDEPAFPLLEDQPDNHPGRYRNRIFSDGKCDSEPYSGKSEKERK